MRIAEVENSLNLDGIDMTSVQTFMDSLRSVPREQVVALNDVLKDKRSEYEARFDGLTTLYHGAPERPYAGDRKLNVYNEIMNNGFKLTQGRRSIGGMGALIVVDNLGIFLTDSKSLAIFFGNNRDDHARGRLITCKVDTTRLLESAKARGPLVKLGCELVNQYNGTAKTRLAMKDWWWLVDRKPFIDAIKAEGYTGVLFQEEVSVRKSANAFDGHTYFIFDPATIHVKTEYTITMFYNDIKRDHA
jgi:hypothetical protein